VINLDTASIVVSIPAAVVGTATKVFELGPHAYQVAQWAIGAFFVYAMVWLIYIPVAKSLSKIFRI